MDKDKPKGLFGGLSGEEKRMLKEIRDATLEQKVQMAAQTEALKAIAEAVKGGQKIEITLNLQMLEQILGIVKDIRHHQSEDSVTKSEIEEVLGPVLARMQAVP